MRPTVYGKEILLDLRGNLLGINLGFNFYNEHECGTQGLVQAVNNHAYEDGCTPAQYRKFHRQVEKAAKKWAKTPLAGYVFAPSSQVFMRKIIVDNSECDAKYPIRQLQDGKYILFSMTGAAYAAPNYWHRRLGLARKFPEDKLLYMPDYNPCRRYFQPGEFGAAWAHDGLMLLLSETAIYNAAVIVEQLTEAIKRNVLACVPQHPAFKLHGCTLVVLDKMPDNVSPLEVKHLLYA